MHESALKLIESVKDYRVLFIGDAIIDEYYYVAPLGKSPKENLIPVRYEDHEEFCGGTHAASHHAISFCSEVIVLCLGKVTRKRRFVESTYLRKLFEVHTIEGTTKTATPMYQDYDAVVVTDFGHGALSSSTIERIIDKSPFLAVCAQTNSSNVGYNLITKYKRADYIVIDEPEARLAAADRDSSIEHVILKLAEGRCKKMIVTHGSKGATGWSEEEGFKYRKAFTNRIVDTMGAGDAFFAVTAPMAKTGSIDDLLLIGNAAGALKTQIVGHRTSITKENLVRFINEAV